ncbi:MarR family winged helix-turn-helix transcriptional regulator [Tenacibaculum maritimum]|uniref:MarR family winged helix-turn-helix transcriptional regulator n=1 Tax=Tenacibaculum maritimum TaxID=107401 RepID=UPI003877327C
MEIFKHKTPSESTGFLLWKVNNLWQREIRKTLKKYDLTHTQFVILATTIWLSDRKSDLTQVEIANQIEIDKMLTSNVLRTLEKNGLLERAEHKTDTRAKTIRPTKKGTELLQKAVQEVENFDDRFFGLIDNIKEFNIQLNKLLRNKYCG